MTKCTLKSFESYINCAFVYYWKISFDNSNWKLATCTCPSYYKKYICKHKVGIAMIANECPNTSKNLPFENLPSNTAKNQTFKLLAK
jgi:uncharacterized Zn finger protein